MPDHRFFRKLGLFTLPGFLSPAECAQMRAAALEHPAEPSVVTQGGYRRVDAQIRRSLEAVLPKPMHAAARQRFESVLPSVASHFATQLEAVEPPQLIRYGIGDHFLPHQDGGEHEDADPEIARRRVSAVVFVNAPNNGEYSGGALTFYGLLPGAAWEKAGMEIQPEAGLLVAFRPTVTHEVTPVTAGVRITLVSWYY